MLTGLQKFTRAGVSELLATLLLTAAFATLTSPALAESQVGNRLEAFSLADQHDKLHSVDGRVKLLIFARDKAANTVITQALGSTPAATIEEKGLVYVADISGMPSLVTKLFALPKMKAYSYPVLLDREGKVTKELPAKANGATLLALDELKIESITFFESPEELARSLSLGGGAK